MAEVPTVHVQTPAGNFYFTPEEYEAMRKMSQAELIEKMEGEFGEEVMAEYGEGPGLNRSQIIYLVNKLQARFITEAL